MKILKKTFALVLVLTMILTLAACSQSGDTGGDAEVEELTDITFVLDWTPNTNHTGLYVAISEGYFEEAGLNVTVVQPPEDGAELLVASGQAQFGVSFQDYLAPAFAQAEPLPITAVAAVLAHNHSGIISLAEKGITSPAELEGHSYATWDLPTELAMMRSVMETDGGNFDNVELIPSMVTDEVTALQSDSVDSIWVFYAWAGIACEVAGLETNYFAFSDIDPVFDFYTPVIIANNSFLEESPETAKAFMAALSKGYEYAIENHEAAADILIAANPELEDSRDLVLASQQYLEGVYQAESARWGEFDAERWNGFFNWLGENGLTESVIPENTGFTNDFLPEAAS